MSEPDIENEPSKVPDRWELWAILAIVLAALTVVMWAIVLAKPGLLGARLMLVIPYFGGSTVVFFAWGLVRTLFNPPVFRRTRTIAFLVLLLCGVIGTVPLIPAPLATEGYTTSNRYDLPLDGDWTVLAGGREMARNYHATFPPTRWGYDFGLARDGALFQLDGKSNTDWYCFDEPVFSPVDGKIVALQNHHVDNNPGEISPSSRVGNFVMIEAEGREFVMLAHLRKGSIGVKIGDEVAAGDAVGKCGNSGQSPGPHVHMHVQDGPDFPVAQGLPIAFAELLVDGAHRQDVMPDGATQWDAADGATVRRLRD